MLQDVPPSPLLTAYFEQKAAIIRLLSARLADRHAAEDIAQDLYLKVAAMAPDSELREPVAYVFRMALNLARDHRRERQRAHNRETDWVDSRSMTVGMDTIADAPSAEDALHAKQRIAAVRAALDELSPQCRNVFVLHKFQGLSHEDVARQAGITRSTVEKHMRTALVHLVHRLGRD
jgi:RNA polymerase sigma-70 factor (ECF subfamily)